MPHFSLLSLIVFVFLTFLLQKKKIVKKNEILNG